MNEREKILESIKKGILSPEEGLDLLESLGLKDTETKAAETSEPQAENITKSETISEPETTEPEKVVESEEEFEVEEIPETEAASDFEDPAPFDEVLEQEYEEKKISEEVPEFNEESAQEPELEAEPAEEIVHGEKQPTDSVASMIDEWENKAEPEPEETDPVRSKIDEFDLALQTKIETLRVKKEEFRELNLEAELGIISSENEVIYNQMKIELKELEEEIELLKHERKAIDEDLFASPERPYVSDGFFEVPDDFEEQKYRPMDPRKSSRMIGLVELVVW